MPAGSPTSYTGDVDYIDMIDWGNSTERYGRLITGDSMEADDPENEDIRDGDVVIFETREPERWHVVHAYNATLNEDTCKIWDKDVLVPNNPDFAPIQMKDPHVWQIIGVAVCVIRTGPRRKRTTVEYPEGLKIKKV